MRRLFKLIIWGGFIIVSLIANFSTLQAELIEPTRTLEGEQQTTGRLTVLSDPPGLEITLDGNSLGKTPAFLVEIDSGIHSLRVENSETDIHIEPGKILKISLHKDEFILMPVAEKKAEKQPEIEVKGEVSEARITRPKSPEQIGEEKRRQAQDRWQRFIDGSSPIF
jgi:hypothetical protein